MHFNATGAYFLLIERDKLERALWRNIIKIVLTDYFSCALSGAVSVLPRRISEKFS